MASYPLPDQNDERLGEGTTTSRETGEDREVASRIRAAQVEFKKRYDLASARLETTSQRDGGGLDDVRDMERALPDVAGAHKGAKSSSAQRKESIRRKPVPITFSDGETAKERTEDTVVARQQRPAVTHETIYETVHEHEQQIVTREIHEYHIHHRILPVHEVEVLPPVHYVQDHRGLRQAPEDSILSRKGESIRRAVEEGFKQSLPQNPSVPGRRQFSARDFEGTKGDYQERTTSDGVKQSRTVWVHPPTLATGARDSGQTQPFHFRPDDGDRIGPK